MSLPFVIRTSGAIDTYLFDPTQGVTIKIDDPRPSIGDCADCEVTFTPEGGAACFTTTDGVSIQRRGDASLGGLWENQVMIAEKKVVNASFSPKGTFLVTYFVPGLSSSVQNLAIWNTTTAEEVTRFQQHIWPALVWTSDESICMRQTATSLTFLDGDIRTKNVLGTLAISPVKGKECIASLSDSNVILIQPSDGPTKPGSIIAHKLNNLQKSAVTHPMTELDGGSVHWCRAGDCALVVAKCDFDKANKSYYGKSSAVLLNVKKRTVMPILLQEGSEIHDISWNPNSTEFVLLHGKMPSTEATIYDAAGQTIYHFGSGPRNVARWSPNGRLIALGGTGSLNGDFSFWDRQNVGKAYMANGMLGSFSLKCASHEWSPCSRYFMCAIVVTRMRANNKVVVYKYTGEEVMELCIDNIQSSTWVPQIPSLFPAFEPERPPIGTAPSAQVKPKPALFVAKHRSGAAAALMSRPQPGETQGFAGTRKIDQHPNWRIEADAKGLPRGAQVLPDDEQDYIPGQKKPKAKKSKEPQNSNLKPSDNTAPIPKTTETSAPAMAPFEDGEDPYKKLRALQKKLRQIEELHSKDKASLTPEQIQKLKGEAELRKEVKQLASWVEANPNPNN